MEEEQPPFFSGASIAIFGLGLMGGSLALALRSSGARLLGIDRDPAVVAQALDRKVVDTAGTSPAGLLSEADIIILAVPVRTILDLLARLPVLHPGAPVVIDLGSTKTAVVQTMAALPERFDPIGGHPMCGKEFGTLANADAGLYAGAPFALVPLERSTPRARRTAEALAQAVGARPLWIEAAQHDRWVAATSHLPHLLATALALSTPGEAAPLAGPGFRSASRLAAGSAEMKTDIFSTNTPAVLAALQRFRQQMDIIEDTLQHSDFDRLQDLLALGAERRQELLPET
jgi:prephenate dehydrogenase